MYLKEEKLEIMHTLNVDRAIEIFGVPPGPQSIHDITGEPVTKKQVVLAGLHKARLAQKKYFSKDEIKASIEYLQDHGYKLGIKR